MAFLLSLRSIVSLAGTAILWVILLILEDEIASVVRHYIPNGGPIMFVFSHPAYIGPALLILVVACLFVESKRRKAQLTVSNEEINSRTLHDNTGNIVGEPVFAELSIASSVDSAKNTRGTITFYKEYGRKEFSMRGRWANSLERSQGATPRDQELRDIRIEYPEPMLVALKYKGEDTAYGLDRHNETKTDWRDDSKPIPKGNHKVKIVLESPNTRNRYEFTRTLINRGNGYDLEWATDSQPKEQANDEPTIGMNDIAPELVRQHTCSVCGWGFRVNLAFQDNPESGGKMP